MLMQEDCAHRMLKARPQMVASVALLDPVCFLLMDSTVCFNFVYRQPQLTSHHMVGRSARSVCLSVTHTHAMVCCAAHTVELLCLS
jgi:hypothetical protein